LVHVRLYFTINKVVWQGKTFVKNRKKC